MNPKNRFESLGLDRDPEDLGHCGPRTQLLWDRTRSIIAYNDSPDVGFEASVNPYRGCEHGCIYCFARPNHEYLGFSAGLDFETRILVKPEAPELLRRELSHPKWRPQPIAISGVTDPYQPIERRLRLSERCLRVLAEFRNPVVVITKNELVTRDADLLGQMARWDGSVVFVSITTLDPDLAGQMEPRASAPAARLRTVERLAQKGVPVGVLVAPVIPALTDHEMPSILKAAAAAGASSAGYVPLRLPYGVAELFERWLETHRPERKSRILNRMRTLRGGSLNDPRFGLRMSGEGPYAAQIQGLFELSCRRLKLNRKRPELDVSHFTRPGNSQRALFEP